MNDPGGWEDLLRHLAGGPRENGSEALRRTAEFLLRTFRDAGIKADLYAYMAHPYRLRLVGVAMLAGCLAFAWLLRRGRAGAALLVLLSITAVTLLETDFYHPLLGWIGAQEQYHVVATVPAVHPTQQLLLTAHYDTKTDALDHVERAPVQFLALPIALFLIGVALISLLYGPRSPSRAVERLTRAAVWVAVAFGIASFISFSAGAFIPSRSHGALDNGAACAVLVRVAERLHDAPRLEHTDVSIVLFSAEEVGVEGSWTYAGDRFASPPARPTWVVNLENIGAAPDLAAFGSESYSLRAYEPSPQLVALLDSVHRQKRGKPLYVTPYPAGTDARSFLAHDVPAATLMSDLPGHPLPRHLHSRQDDRRRIEEPSLDVTVDYLLAVVRRLERAAGVS